jgi:hypothetical protein
MVVAVTVAVTMAVTEASVAVGGAHAVRRGLE